MMIFIPVIIILLNVERILLALKQDPEVSRLTQEYVRVYLPGLLVMGLVDLQSRFLNSLGKNYVPMICLSIGIVLHIISNYIFVLKMHLGLKGTGYAGVITNIFILSLQLWYTTKLKDIKPAIFWFDGRTFKGLKTYFQYGIPSCIMLCLDQWVYEMMVVISGTFGVH